MTYPGGRQMHPEKLLWHCGLHLSALSDLTQVQQHVNWNCKKRVRSWPTGKSKHFCYRVIYMPAPLPVLPSRAISSSTELLGPQLCSAYVSPNSVDCSGIYNIASEKHMVAKTTTPVEEQRKVLVARERDKIDLILLRW